jgi:hypothetical protein
MSGQERPPSRAAAKLVIAAAAVVALVVGGTGGLVLGTELVLGSSDPHGLPGLPADFPDPSLQHLPDLTVTEVTSNLADLGLECESLTSPGAPHLQDCVVFVPQRSGGTSSAGHFRALIEYDGESEVRALTTSCYRGADGPTGLCHDPFQLSVDIVFDGQPPDARDQALDWVEQYADDQAIIENEAEAVTRAGEIALTVSGRSFDDGDALYELVLRRA